MPSEDSPTAGRKNPESLINSKTSRAPIVEKIKVEGEVEAEAPAASPSSLNVWLCKGSAHLFKDEVTPFATTVATTGTELQFATSTDEVAEVQQSRTKAAQAFSTKSQNQYVPDYPVRSVSAAAADTVATTEAELHLATSTDEVAEVQQTKTKAAQAFSTRSQSQAVLDSSVRCVSAQPAVATTTEENESKCLNRWDQQNKIEPSANISDFDLSSSFSCGEVTKTTETLSISQPEKPVKADTDERKASPSTSCPLRSLANLGSMSPLSAGAMLVTEPEGQLEVACTSAESAVTQQIDPSAMNNGHGSSIRDSTDSTTGDNDGSNHSSNKNKKGGGFTLMRRGSIVVNPKPMSDETTAEPDNQSKAFLVSSSDSSLLDQARLSPKASCLDSIQSKERMVTECDTTLRQPINHRLATAELQTRRYQSKVSTAGASLQEPLKLNVADTTRVSSNREDRGLTSCSSILESISGHQAPLCLTPNVTQDLGCKATQPNTRLSPFKKVLLFLGASLAVSTSSVSWWKPLFSVPPSLSGASQKLFEYNDSIHQLDHPTSNTASGCPWSDLHGES